VPLLLPSTGTKDDEPSSSPHQSPRPVFPIARFALRRRARRGVLGLEVRVRAADGYVFGLLLIVERMNGVQTLTITNTHTNDTNNKQPPPPPPGLVAFLPPGAPAAFHIHNPRETGKRGGGDALRPAAAARGPARYARRWNGI
jgi:hypothetical protein